MSAGTQVYTLRLDNGTVIEIRCALARANKFRKAAPYDFSGWIRAAIQEKLAKGKRGRAKKTLTPPAPIL